MSCSTNLIEILYIVIHVNIKIHIYAGFREIPIKVVHYPCTLKIKQQNLLQMKARNMVLGNFV